MLVCYALEDRGPGFVLGFVAACALGSAYGFLQGAWPFGLVEAIWAVVALSGGAFEWLARTTAWRRDRVAGMNSFGLSRRVAAEALGTGLLVATVVGSGIMAERLAGGNVAIALLGNTLPTGAILVVLILALAPISGAHFNPAVSLVMAVNGGLQWREAGAYVVAQIVGGCFGTLAAHGMFDLPLLQLATKARTGPAQWFAEFVATFGLLMTILAVVRFRIDAIPIAVGLYITAAYWFTASTSFANPAVTIARALTDTFAGIAPGDVPMFIVAQICGALTAMAAMAWLLGPANRKA